MQKCEIKSSKSVAISLKLQSRGYSRLKNQWVLLVFKQCVSVSNHLLWRAQQVFILCIMIILVLGVVSVVYSFHIHLHTVMWEACICGVLTSVVTSGFYTALEELCLTVSCCDLQEWRAMHSPQHPFSRVCHLLKTTTPIAGVNLEQTEKQESSVQVWTCHGYRPVQ